MDDKNVGVYRVASCLSNQIEQNAENAYTPIRYNPTPQNLCNNPYINRPTKYRKTIYTNIIKDE